MRSLVIIYHMLQYLHSDSDGVEFYFDTTTHELLVRDSRVTNDPIRECKIPWTILKSKVKEIYSGA